MSSLTELSVRPAREADIEQLDAFRRANFDADIEIPFGYAGPGVETAVAEKHGTLVGGMTAVSAVVLDFMRNPEASGVDTYTAVFMLERALAYVAGKHNIPVSYVAIPSHLTDYISMVQRSGYELACENCVIMRRPLRKELTPSLSTERAQP
jgi:hypothetical protein